MNSIKILVTFILSALSLSISYANNTKEEYLKTRYIDEIKVANTVVICEFNKPKGMIITEVIKGDKRMQGELWNSSMFPQKSILLVHKTNDYIGFTDRPTAVSNTYFYLYDKNTDEIYSTDIEGKKLKFITLKELKKRLRSPVKP